MPVPLSGSSRCDLRCVTRCPCKSVYHSIARVGEGMRCHQALPTTHAVTGAGGRNSRRHLISRQTNSSFVRLSPGGAREIATCKVASEDREVALENLSGRVDEVVKEAVDIARQIKELEELGPRETGISNDELDEVKKKLLAFLELSFLPENALDLLTAAGYIRQDEWHLLYDKQKQRQKEAKDRREENHYKVIQHVLSGERERNVESDMRSKESQDPQAFLRNINAFFDAVQHEYEKGKWKNVHIVDVIRDRSNKPKTLDDFRASNSASIPPPARPVDEEKEFRRAERILFALQDGYSKGGLGDILDALTDADLVDREGIAYTDPFVRLCGWDQVCNAFHRLSDAGMTLELDFIWSEAEVQAEVQAPSPHNSNVPRKVHVEYYCKQTFLGEISGGNNKKDSPRVLMLADYVIDVPRGLVESIEVSFPEEPSRTFMRKYREAVSS